MKVRLLNIILFITMPLNMMAQVNNELKELFVEAESHYLFGEYKLANPLYLMLNDYLPENANIKYKIGNCYINIADEKSKAIPYLEEAVKNVDYNAKEELFKETRAPLYAYFALGQAYQINNELEKAIQTYNKFKELMSQGQGLINAEFVDQQILACRNAMTLMENPKTLNMINLGEDINLSSININPAVSGNGNSLVYTVSFGEDYMIYFSQREAGKWTSPININAALGCEKENDCTSSALNYDGTELYLWKSDGYVGNIYVSKLENGEWKKIEKLNRNINTKYYESHASISKDNNTLYFTSNRPGGLGQLDVYKSTRDEDGEWGPAENLGSTINTAFNEDTPFICENDSILFFASEGHTSMGGYDIFKSIFLGEQWKTPSNLGYPVNTTDNDRFFQPIKNGQTGYYSMLTGYKSKEIFQINIEETVQKRVLELKGYVSLQDTIRPFDERFKVSMINDEGDTIDLSYPNRRTGFYSFKFNPGNYLIVYEGEGYLTQEEQLEILPDHPDNEILIDVELVVDPHWEPAVVEELPEVFEQIDLSAIPTIDQADSSTLITNLIVRDVDYQGDESILYYTVQIMALYNPVDISYFKYINDVVVVYNKDDLFYRYTTGRFDTEEAAEEWRTELIRRGYPEEIFIKKVYAGEREQ